VAELLAERSDATLTELATAFEQRTGRATSAMGIVRSLRRSGITRKKRRSAPRSV